MEMDAEYLKSLNSVLLSCANRAENEAKFQKAVNSSLLDERSGYLARAERAEAERDRAIKIDQEAIDELMAFNSKLEAEVAALKGRVEAFEKHYRIKSCFRPGDKPPDGFDAICASCFCPYTFGNSRSVGVKEPEKFCSNICAALSAPAPDGGEKEP